jgi:autophagy-related protein 9
MWNAATTQQPVHSAHNPSGVLRDRPRSVLKSIKTSNARDKAMWRWVNVTNLDSFVRDVYNYYEGGGLWVIQSSNALQLL